METSYPYKLYKEDTAAQLRICYFLSLQSFWRSRSNCSIIRHHSWASIGAATNQPALLRFLQASLLGSTFSELSESESKKCLARFLPDTRHKLVARIDGRSCFDLLCHRVLLLSSLHLRRWSRHHCMRPFRWCLPRWSRVNSTSHGFRCFSTYRCCDD